MRQNRDVVWCDNYVDRQIVSQTGMLSGVIVMLTIKSCLRQQTGMLSGVIVTLTIKSCLRQQTGMLSGVIVMLTIKSCLRQEYCIIVSQTGVLYDVIIMLTLKSCFRDVVWCDNYVDHQIVSQTRGLYNRVSDRGAV